MSEVSATQDEMPREERRELMAELREHITRVHDGDKEAVEHIERSLELVPSIARKWGNLNLMVERGFIERTATNDPVVQKSVKITLENMREELAGPNPSPLELLGAERVASCWLQLHYAELLYEQNLPKLTLSEDDYYQKRLDRLHRRYLSAMRSLA